MRRLAIALSILALISLAATPWEAAADGPEAVDSVAGQLMCQCGCGLTVAACGGAMACDIADKMKVVVADQLAQGRTKADILAYFVNIYGEVVLAAPPKRGFTLSAWITPFVAVGGGAVMVAALLWLWARRRPPAPEGAPLAQEETLQPYLERVDLEMKGWE